MGSRLEPFTVSQPSNRFMSIYPLVNVYIIMVKIMGNHNVSTCFLGQLLISMDSMAMLLLPEQKPWLGSSIDNSQELETEKRKKRCREWWPVVAAKHFGDVFICPVVNGGSDSEPLGSLFILPKKYFPKLVTLTGNGEPTNLYQLSNWWWLGDGLLLSWLVNPTWLADDYRAGNDSYIAMENASHRNSELSHEKM